MNKIVKLNNEGINEGYLALFEAIMRQAYADANSNNETLKAEAETFIAEMKEAIR